jgi:SAM-dependent methyltransferase
LVTARGDDAAALTCPLGHGLDWKVVGYRADGSRLLGCRSCGIVHVPAAIALADATTYERDAYHGGSETSHVGYTRDYQSQFEGSAHWRFALDALRAEAGTGELRTAIDVGCASGEFMAKLAADGWMPTGLDLSPAALTAVKGRGFVALRGELPTIAPQLPEYDLVTMLFVLEHVVRPDEYLSAAMRVLRPGGRLLVAVPNSRTRILLRANWSQNANYYEHLWFFTPATVRSLLERASLRPVRVFTRSLFAPVAITVSAALGHADGRPSQLSMRSLARGLWRGAIRPVELAGFGEHIYALAIR